MSSAPTKHAPIATAREEARIDAFIAGLRARGRRPATLEAYRAEWQAA